MSEQVGVVPKNILFTLGDPVMASSLHQQNAAALERYGLISPNEDLAPFEAVPQLSDISFFEGGGPFPIINLGLDRRTDREVAQQIGIDTGSLDTYQLKNILVVGENPETHIVWVIPNERLFDPKQIDTPQYRAHGFVGDATFRDVLFFYTASASLMPDEIYVAGRGTVVTQDGHRNTGLIPVLHVGGPSGETIELLSSSDQRITFLSVVSPYQATESTLWSNAG